MMWVVTSSLGSGEAGLRSVNGGLSVASFTLLSLPLVAYDVSSGLVCLKNPSPRLDLSRQPWIDESFD